MRRTRISYSVILLFGFALFVVALVGNCVPQTAGDAVRVESGEISGVVTSTAGPEAGVWVIAETEELPTKLVKIVVTDDRGRFLVPELPKATYSIWVRGYGLVDSPKVQSVPGKILNLTAVVAPDAAAAAQYYPAIYWYSLLRPPSKSEFSSTQDNGNSAEMKNQAEYLRLLRTDGCMDCHVLGNMATRTIPKALGHFDTSKAAWARRIQSGQAGPVMVGVMARLGWDRGLAMFSEWTDRIAAGELPPVPQRPQGKERNVVITEWDWAGPKLYLHDEVSTDKRNPTINPYGPIYGAAENSTDSLPVLDPLHNMTSLVSIPLRDPNTPAFFDSPDSNGKSGKPLRPSPYWGEEALWNSKANVHTPTFDEKGRVWMTSKIRANDNPAFCKQGSNHPSAKLFPLASSDRQLALYDPKSKQFTLISTCFTTQHLNFAEDANNTLWTSTGGVRYGAEVGWLNTKMFAETGDEEKSQGWTPLILDMNGNGKQDAWVEPDQPIDPTKDKRINVGFYGVTPNPVDGSVWGTGSGFPGAIVRLNPGTNPPATALAEIYEPPWNNLKAPVQGYSPKGIDIDRNGVVWVTLSSGHFASFDRRKCKGPLNGPTATGQHCPEGWTLYPLPGPKFSGITESGSAEGAYYDWVDQFDTFGLGKNVPIATGNGNAALLALMPDTGKFFVFRLPYPMGFYAKGLDGRIDDPKAGWKGKGLWVTYGSKAPFHMEGGKGTAPKLMHFQLRPDPLAK